MCFKQRPKMWSLAAPHPSKLSHCPVTPLDPAGPQQSRFGGYSAEVSTHVYGPCSRRDS